MEFHRIISDQCFLSIILINTRLLNSGAANREKTECLGRQAEEGDHSEELLEGYRDSAGRDPSHCPTITICVY